MRAGRWIESSTSSKSLITGNVRIEESRKEMRNNPGAPSPPANATTFCFHPLRFAGKLPSSVRGCLSLPEGASGNDGGKFSCSRKSLAAVQHFIDGARQARQVALLNDEGWREVDDIAEWFDPASFFNKTCPELERISRAIHLNYADRALDADFFHSRRALAGAQFVFQLRFNHGHLPQPRFALEQIERSVSGRATQWIGHIRRSVHQCGVRIIG